MPSQNWRNSFLEVESYTSSLIINLLFIDYIVFCQKINSNVFLTHSLPLIAKLTNKLSFILLVVFMCSLERNS